MLLSTAAASAPAASSGDLVATTGDAGSGASGSVFLNSGDADRGQGWDVVHERVGEEGDGLPLVQLQDGVHSGRVGVARAAREVAEQVRHGAAPCILQPQHLPDEVQQRPVARPGLLRLGAAREVREGRGLAEASDGLGRFFFLGAALPRTPPGLSPSKPSLARSSWLRLILASRSLEEGKKEPTNPIQSKHKEKTAKKRKGL